MVEMSFVHLDVGGNKKLKQRRDRKKKKIRRKKKEEEEEGERDGDEEEDHVEEEEEEEEEAEEKEGGRNGVGIMVENEFRPPRRWWQIRNSSRKGKQKKKLHLRPLILLFVLPRLLSSYKYIVMATVCLSAVRSRHKMRIQAILWEELFATRALTAFSRWQGSLVVRTSKQPTSMLEKCHTLSPFEAFDLLRKELTPAPRLSFSIFQLCFRVLQVVILNSVFIGAEVELSIQTPPVQSPFMQAEPKSQEVSNIYLYIKYYILYIIYYILYIFFFFLFIYYILNIIYYILHIIYYILYIIYYIFYIIYYILYILYYILYIIYYILYIIHYILYIIY